MQTIGGQSLGEHRAGGIADHGFVVAKSEVPRCGL
jgi:hypothetical protein